MVMDLRPSNDILFAQLGVAAFITPPGEPQIETVISWLAPTTARINSEEMIEEQRLRLAVRRDHVAALPIGTVINTIRPPEFPDPHDFIVDRVEDLDPDVFYVRVH